MARTIPTPNAQPKAREQFWLDHLRACRERGQTLKAYAYAQGLSVSTLYSARSALRRRTQCRILYWERCGFVLWQKRLERARFAWPRRTDAVVSLSGAQLNFLLDGYNLWRMRPHHTLHYASLYRGSSSASIHTVPNDSLFYGP